MSIFIVNIKIIMKMKKIVRSKVIFINIYKIIIIINNNINVNLIMKFLNKYYYIIRAIVYFYYLIYK